MLSQEEIERKLMEQMNEKFQLKEMQLRQELARKVCIYMYMYVYSLILMKLSYHYWHRSLTHNHGWSHIQPRQLSCLGSLQYIQYVHCMHAGD